jgi:hypothetical protein
MVKVIHRDMTGIIYRIDFDMLAACAAEPEELPVPGVAFAVSCVEKKLSAARSGMIHSSWASNAGRLLKGSGPRS